MKRLVKVSILRVFADAEGKFGNIASVIVDEKRKLDTFSRQTITKQLGYDETVFVNDLRAGKVSIFSRRGEIKFAGHALVGTAWLLFLLGGDVIKTIHCLGGDIAVWKEGDLTWVRASLNIMPPWNLKRLENPYDIVRITPLDAVKMKHTLVWAWIDKTKGTIRARTFATDWGIPESEGNGSGSMILAAQLKQKLEITHGKGSVIYANPCDLQLAEIGGRVVQEPTKQITLNGGGV